MFGQGRNPFQTQMPMHARPSEGVPIPVTGLPPGYETMAEFDARPPSQHPIMQYLEYLWNQEIERRTQDRMRNFTQPSYPPVFAPIDDYGQGERIG